jgi:hypothetical protein
MILTAYKSPKKYIGTLIDKSCLPDFGPSQERESFRAYALILKEETRI